MLITEVVEERSKEKHQSSTRVPAKKCKTLVKYYYNEKINEKNAFIEEMKSEDYFNAVVFKTILEEIAAQGIEEITNLGHAFFDLILKLC